jgi:hypothetical protein
LAFPHENRLRPLLSYPLIWIAGFLPLLGRNTVAKVRPDRKPAVAWKPQRPFGGARVGKLSRGSVGPRTTTYVSMRLQKGEHPRRRGATRAERGWAHHPHTVARAERGHRRRLDPAAWHEVQLAALGRQGEEKRRLHQQPRSKRSRCDHRERFGVRSVLTGPCSLSGSRRRYHRQGHISDATRERFRRSL